jgi:hypothetical protein
MVKNKLSFHLLHYCCLLVSLNLFSQTEIYKSDFQFENVQSKKKLDSLLAAKNKIIFNNTSGHKTKINNTHSFILSENQLLVLDNNRKKVLQLHLQTAFPTDNFTPDAYTTTIEIHPESVWFYYQNYLIHYDFMRNKLLRKVDLTPWKPNRVELDNRTIWLISKNDGQLYGLDFEPDQKTADFIKAKAEREREINNPKPPDKKKIEAAKAAQQKFKNKTN